MIRVTCAIIRNEENEVLIVQRGENSDHPFKWEFPGGKVNDGETDEDCIIREIREELAMNIVIFRKLENVEYDYGRKHILLVPFICDTLDELPVLSEHISFRWIDPSLFPEIDFSEADVLAASIFTRETVGNVPENLQISPDKEQMVPDEELQEMITRMSMTKQVNWIAISAKDNPAVLKKLIEYSYSADRRLAAHSSWSLTKVFDLNKDLITPFLPAIIGSLQKVKNESVERSFLKIVSLSEIRDLSEKYHGILAEHCFNRLRSGFSAIAIKAYSMDIIYKLALIYPELVNELAASMSMLKDDKSAGIIARSRIILKKLDRLDQGKGSDDE
ncbi:MAG TPA: (deoxy)nucleoside triphosphate pyrophosphohydrolase [Bacteroidales bacterium]|jgi:8-oxo-dGTP diphosphatase|nr:NUDIX domain-containing protein [Bacteroidales bacterium]OQB60265.1 MAG: 8-oxo-dGTP diphosphatase [Bacteroidetes bacterium ADurb.Bin145]HOU03168.1 (deoxy)nucleoside triphosphate pyrophosphohydrolase [Bacteroidales bacterium]HQG64029.1 (deoxy)nucleoside triphosphate pyrophosphohydrolase [Bacteroidales bacterium]HQK69007.1 (deoxy)nucleoside triphosphate pyrophosphohydrolase [Bacteroidales bacterium]